MAGILSGRRRGQCAVHRLVKIEVSHCLVMGGWVVFCEIIGKIFGSFFPVYLKFFLPDSVADPMEAHVHGFGSLLFACVVEDAMGCCVVRLDRCGRLRVAHFCQRGAKNCGVLGVVEQGSNFCFGGGCENLSHD